MTVKLLQQYLSEMPSDAMVLIKVDIVLGNKKCGSVHGSMIFRGKDEDGDVILEMDE